MRTRNHTPFISKALYWVVMLIVSLSAFGGVNLKTAHAQENTDEAQPAATVTLSVDKNSFGAAEDVILHVTVTNPGSQSIKVLGWFIPIASVEESLFTVARDGEPVDYFGVIAKRVDPTEQDYVSLAAGESLTRDVNLGAYYDLAVSGNYIVNYSVSSEFLYLADASGFIAGSLDSNILELSIEGRPAASPVQDGVVDLAVIGTSAFNSCTATRQADLISARDAASVYLADAATYFSAGQHGDRYTTWFGIHDVSRYNTVSSHFSALQNAVDNASPMTFDCTCSVSDPANTFAYVYANQPYTIHLCGAFWSAPTTGTDSKAGTLIHETTHFTVVAATHDYAYGQIRAKSLAITNPARSIMNADSHEYFAENNLPSSEITYLGPLYTISGNAGAGNVTLTYIGDTSSGAALAGSDGSYSFKVKPNWSGTVTPSKTGYTFSPPIFYNNVNADQTAQNYTATSISGDTYEYDDNSAWAKLISSGAPQPHSIIPAADVDWIKFQVTGLSAITLETSGATSADTRMWLYNSSLTQVEFNDDGGAGYYSKIDRLCSVDALPSGTYYVKVDEYGNNNPISSYTLSLIVDPCFRKTSPENGAINESLSPTLSWLSTVVPDSYEYCLEDTASNITNLCDTSWVSTGTATSKSLSGLSVGTTYYWQVRATDIAGTTYANGSETAYGSFTTGYAPAVFNKFGPVNAATEVVLFPVLKWASSKGVTPASSYEYCYDTTNDNACSNWIDNRLSTNTSLSNLSPLTTYYWNVRAKNEFGITNSYNNEWWTFTTKSTSLHISYSAAANDGWTLESSRFSSVASTKSAAGTLRVGNDARTRQYRSILHFDTASLPDNAIITNVTLQIKKASDGTPTPGDFVADIKKGFFGLASLELGDFNAAAEPINNAGRFVVTSDPNGYWLTLSSVNFKYINLFGATQFRLRFTKDDKAGYISFYAGDAALSNQPQLSVEYWVP